jgi:Fe2+ or Zn2+ uptake regulation protein
MTVEVLAEPDLGEQRLRDALGVLRSAGLHRTPRHITVLRVLIEAGRHLTLNEITERMHRAGTDADFSTAWHAVLTLTNVGLVHALRAETAIPTYGLADRPHFHAVCARCDAVAEVPTELLATTVDEIEQVTGYSVAAGSVLATGLCPQCA